MQTYVYFGTILQLAFIPFVQQNLLLIALSFIYSKTKTKQNNHNRHCHVPCALKHSNIKEQPWVYPPTTHKIHEHRNPFEIVYSRSRKCICHYHPWPIFNHVYKYINSFYSKKKKIIQDGIKERFKIPEKGQKYDFSPRTCFLLSCTSACQSSHLFNFFFFLK